MKHLIALSGIAIALMAAAPTTLAQSSPPLPTMTPQQSQAVKAQIDAYRHDTDARVARGEITADEAARLVQWREWQFAQQAAGIAPWSPNLISDRSPANYAARPPVYYEPRPSDYYVVEPAPAYVPDYRHVTPYYWGPRPYAYWGPSVCAGGFGRHFGGRICF